MVSLVQQECIASRVPRLCATNYFAAAFAHANQTPRPSGAWHTSPCSTIQRARTHPCNQPQDKNHECCQDETFHLARKAHAPPALFPVFPSRLPRRFDERGSLPLKHGEALASSIRCDDGVAARRHCSTPYIMRLKLSSRPGNCPRIQLRSQRGPSWNTRASL